MTKLTQRIMKNGNGATAIAYGPIAAFIAVAIVTAVTSVGTSLSGIFTLLNSAF